jgi:hypothetical protein
MSPWKKLRTLTPWREALAYLCSLCTCPHWYGGARGWYTEPQGIFKSANGLKRSTSSYQCCSGGMSLGGSLAKSSHSAISPTSRARRSSPAAINRDTARCRCCRRRFKQFPAVHRTPLASVLQYCHREAPARVGYQELSDLQKEELRGLLHRYRSPVKMQENRTHEGRMVARVGRLRLLYQRHTRCSKISL